MAEKASTKKPKTETTKAQTTKASEAVKKPNKGIFAGIIVAVAIIAIGIAVALLNGSKADPADVTAKIDYTRSFFIYDNNKYTLWNDNGQRLTEDEYKYRSDFVGGYAYVEKDGQYGVINENGRMSVEFGKYGSISAKSGLFLAQDGNTKEYFLITGSGKQLANGDKLDVYTSSSTCGFAAVKLSDRIRIFNYAGNLVAEVAIADDADDPVMSNSSDFGLFHYADTNLLFDARNGMVLAKFDGSRHTFEVVSDDRSVIILENYDDSHKYKLVRGGKIYDLDEAKYYGVTDFDDVLGYDGSYSKLALLDNDYKILKWVSAHLELKDSYNYATEKEDGGVEIYYNGNLVKEFNENASIASTGVLYENYYAIEDGDKAMFYNLDGSLGINHEYREIKTLFRRNHHAVVSDAEDEYYLIDARGNRVGNAVAKDISVYASGYVLENSDGKYAIADKNGLVVTEFKYTDTDYRSYAKPRNIWTGSNGKNSYDVIDVDNGGKVILADANVQSFYANYFTVKNTESKNEYYTYTGTLFYTSGN